MNIVFVWKIISWRFHGRNAAKFPPRMTPNTTKLQEIGFLFQKISGGACPQTPLVLTRAPTAPTIAFGDW